MRLLKPVVWVILAVAFAAGFLHWIEVDCKERKAEKQKQQIAEAVAVEKQHSWPAQIGPENWARIEKIIKAQIAESARKNRRACWTDAGYYPGGKDLQGRPYIAKGMVCAANMPEINVRRHVWLRVTRPGYEPIVVWVNDFGPDRRLKEYHDRGVDLSPDAARALNMIRIGHCPVYVENIGQGNRK